MRIGVSAFAGDGGRSGISQYMEQVVGRIARIAPQHRLVTFVAGDDADWVRGWDAPIEVVEFPARIAQPTLNIAWHLARFPAALRAQRCDLAFMPAANRRLAWHYGCPSVGTVHDFSQRHVPQKYDRLRTLYVKRLLPAMMRRLDRVIAVSESTRRDCEDFAHIPGERIRVCYNGADLSRYTASARTAARAEVQAALGGQLPAEAPYLLYTSRLEHPGKNHVRLLEAFAQLRQRRGLPHRLVLAGTRWSGAEAIDAKLAELDLGSAVIITGFVASELLPALYRAADLFVFPSLFEGFGIPVLEAMASGVPVCAADRASIPEVLGDAGLLFDPDDPTAIADAIERLLGDDALRADCIARGLERCRTFTWDHTAEIVLAELERAAHATSRV
jgi:glycosyltransferase involved in cell wall biosynthesis